ncbi:MAG TPA: methyltransferase [Burkholderiales bacterium]|nr:methyltransferase [Burkholderiales bacterium]
MDANGARVREMIDGYRLSQAIFVAAELRIADRLGDEAAHYDALATATGTDAPSLLRLLRALASAGLLRDAGEGKFASTPLGGLLRQDVEGSLHAWARLNTSLYHPWGNLLGSIRTGKQAFESAHGKSRWQHLADCATDSRTFNDAMAETSAQVAREVLAACDLSRFDNIVDVGGGNGALLRAVLEACPRSRGVLFDLPEAIRDASRSVHERCRLVEGSFLDAVPEGGDAYLLSRVLHDWDDEHAGAVLRNTRHAMANGAALFVIERIVEPGQPRLEAALSDLSMLVMNGGRERTRGEFEHLLAAARFGVARVVTTPPRFGIIEAKAV